MIYNYDDFEDFESAEEFFKYRRMAKEYKNNENYEIIIKAYIKAKGEDYFSTNIEDFNKLRKWIIESTKNDRKEFLIKSKKISNIPFMLIWDKETEDPENSSRQYKPDQHNPYQIAYVKRIGQPKKGSPVPFAAPMFGRVYRTSRKGFRMTKGILESLLIEEEKLEDEELTDAIFESVLDSAMEFVKPILDKKRRAALPDSAFAIVYTNKAGETVRKYPLVVKNDPEATKELINKAIEYFNFCKPDWKEELAKAIIKAINETGIDVKIHPKNNINKFVTVPSKYIKVDTNDKYNKSNK